MNGRRHPDCDWDPLLGIAILEARRALYEDLSQEVGIPQPKVFWRSHDAIGAFMGLSGTAVQHIERIALRKLRVALIYRENVLGGELLEALRSYGRTKSLSPR